MGGTITIWELKPNTMRNSGKATKTLLVKIRQINKKSVKFDWLLARTMIRFSGGNNEDYQSD